MRYIYTSDLPLFYDSFPESLHHPISSHLTLGEKYTLPLLHSLYVWACKTLKTHTVRSDPILNLVAQPIWLIITRVEDLLTLLVCPLSLHWAWWKHLYTLDQSMFLRFPLMWCDLQCCRPLPSPLLDNGPVEDKFAMSNQHIGWLDPQSCPVVKLWSVVCVLRGNLDDSPQQTSREWTCG